MSMADRGAAVLVGAEVTSTDVLVCDGLRKRFGDVEAVRGVCFHIAEGETYGLLGPNGAGKTTTISMVCGLLEPDAGEVLVAGRPLTTRSVAAKAAIGYVPQELAIYPDLNARENLRFFARLYGLGSAEATARVDEVLLGDRSRGSRGRADQDLPGGHAATAEHRHRPVAPPPPAHPRRADRRRGSQAATRSWRASSAYRARGWRCSIRRTTWRRPSACATASASSTSGSSRPRGRGGPGRAGGEHDRVVLGGAGDLAAASRACEALGPVRASSVQAGGTSSSSTAPAPSARVAAGRGRGGAR